MIGYSSAQCIKTGYSSVQCIKIGYSSFQCVKIRYSSAQCIKIWKRVFSALCDNFRIFFHIFGHLRPPGIIIPPPDKFWPSRDNFSAACLPAVHLRSLPPRLPSAVAAL